MKTILVTGAAGYIGRHVVKNALDRGCKVIASDFSFKGVDERAEFCDVPIFSGDKEIYRKVGSPDICIHLAWRDGFRHNSPAHMKDLSAHVTFLNDLVAGGLKDLSVMGTMHEVGYWEGAINESTPCKPQSQYGIANTDYKKPEETGLPAANVLVYKLEGGAEVIVRPSGTEPKIKTYFTTLGKNLAEAQAQKDALAAAIAPIFE